LKSCICNKKKTLESLKSQFSIIRSFHTYRKIVSLSNSIETKKIYIYEDQVNMSNMHVGMGFVKTADYHCMM
jgi:hypothetical protein